MSSSYYSKRSHQLTHLTDGFSSIGKIEETTKGIVMSVTHQSLSSPLRCTSYFSVEEGWITTTVCRLQSFKQDYSEELVPDA